MGSTRPEKELSAAICSWAERSSRGVVRGGHDLELEFLEQFARAEIGLLHDLLESVVDLVSVGLVDLGVIDAEHVDELGPQPVAGSRAVVEVPVAAEDPPGLTRVGAVALAHVEVGEVHAVGVQQPGHVVVRADEQFRGIRERGVVRDDPGIHVPVRRDDRQVLDLLQKVAGDAPGARVSRQQSVRVGCYRR